jgi:Protein of unknown function (DUF2384)
MCTNANPASDPSFIDILSIRPAVKQAVAELQCFLDSSKVAAWFREPNLWLGNRRPLDLVDESPDCVLGAARADRCVARG